MERLNFTPASEYLEDKYKELLLRNNLLVVSGQPQLHCSADSKELLLYGDCSPVVDTVVRVNHLTRQNIPKFGYNHLPDHFTGEYCLLSVTNTESGEIYHLPVKEELGFRAVIWQPDNATTLEHHGSKPEIFDLLALFSVENWANGLPVLEEFARAAIRGYLQSRNMKMIAGSIAIRQDGTSSTLGSGGGIDRSLVSILANNPGAVPGPYYLGDRYFEHGVGIWAEDTGKH